MKTSKEVLYEVPWSAEFQAPAAASDGVFLMLRSSLAEASRNEDLMTGMVYEVRDGKSEVHRLVAEVPKLRTMETLRAFARQVNDWLEERLGVVPYPVSFRVIAQKGDR